MTVYMYSKLPSFIAVLSEGREVPNTTVRGPLSARQRNAMDAGLVALSWILVGI